MIKGHGGNIHELARELGCAPSDIIDMSSNINPLGPVPGLHEHLRENMDAVNALPEVDGGSLLEAFAGDLGITADLDKVVVDGELDADVVLFSETASRFVVTIKPKDQQAFEELLQGNAVGLVGTVVDDAKLKVSFGDTVVVDQGIGELKDAWQGTMRW